MTRLKLAVALGAWVLLAACGKSGEGPDNTLQPGQTDFVTLEPGSYGPGYGGVGASPEAAGGQGTSAEPPSADSKGAPSGREGTVEEADIYRVDNNRLFYLNAYRGLVIYDLADPSNPKRISRVPIFGHPVEMFVSNNTVFALFQSVLYLKQKAERFQFERHDVSQLVAIDISNPAQPTILKRMDIVGQLREGVSRKIDDTLYVVSYLPQSYYYFGYPYGDNRKEQAWVYSYNVSNPSNPVQVQSLKVFEGGGGSSSAQPNGGSSRYFSGVTLSATANTLHVVENWTESAYQYGNGCGNYRSKQEAVVSIIDISDPTGQIRLHSKFTTDGQLRDQFKQTYVYDEATKKGTYLGIFARQEWNSANCTSNNVITNTLESWDITDGANPKKLSSLGFGKPNETVVGSAFDPSRKVAYAITARQIDPLYVLSYADPANLKVLSAIDGLSGDMSLFRLIGNNQFLIGIGRDNSTTCTGFDSPASGWSTNVAVSIIDVQKLDAARLVQRRCVTVKDAQWITSQVSWNLDQAHKMIGMNSDARANVITVPVSYYRREDQNTGWWYRYESAVGMMTWDLTKYDPTKNELQQQVLQNFGTVLHPHGQVLRSIVFTHQGTSKRMMVNLSDTHLSVVDIDDLNAPVTKAMVEIAPYVQEIYRFGNFMVEHTHPDGYGGWYSNAASEFRVKGIGGELADATPVATFTLGQVERVMKWNNSLLIFRAVPNSASGPYGTRTSQLVVYDLSNPAQPQLRSSTDLPWPTSFGWMFSCGMDWGGYYWFSGGTNTATTTSTGVAMLQYNYANGSSTQSLGFIDLSNPAAPAISSTEIGNGSSTYALGIIRDESNPQALYVSHKELLSSFKDPSGQQLNRFRYYVQRWVPSAGGITKDGGAINLPGQATRAWTGNAGQQFLSQDYRYVPVTTQSYTYFQSEPRLHLLARVPGQSRAVLKDTRVFTDEYLGQLLPDGDRLFVTSSPAYRYYGAVSSSSTTPAAPQKGQQLAMFDLSAGKFELKSQSDLGLQYATLMGARSGRLFLSLSGDGILVVDASDLSNPVGQRFLRTLGWTTHIEFTEDTLFAAAGYFGVMQYPLLTGTLNL